jgi:DNA-directed RNA polymerase specialized sigma24 family protein
MDDLFARLDVYSRRFHLLPAYRPVGSGLELAESRVRAGWSRRTVFRPNLTFTHSKSGPQKESSVFVASDDRLREKPALTQFAFGRLLDWLDDGVDSQGEMYLEMQQRLVAYFDRRNRPFPDELADETFNRIARTLGESVSIAVTPPARYCYVVARFVLLEDIRRRPPCMPVNGVLADRCAPPRMTIADEETLIREHRLECLDECLQKLTPEQREIAIEYYRGAKGARIDRRRELAHRLGITANALGIRASRIRRSLERCVERCGTRP